MYIAANRSMYSQNEIKRLLYIAGRIDQTSCAFEKGANRYRQFLAVQQLNIINSICYRLSAAADTRLARLYEIQPLQYITDYRVSSFRSGCANASLQLISTFTATAIILLRQIRPGEVENIVCRVSML